MLLIRLGESYQQWPEFRSASKAGTAKFQDKIFKENSCEPVQWQVLCWAKHNCSDPLKLVLNHRLDTQNMKHLSGYLAPWACRWVLVRHLHGYTLGYQWSYPDPYPPYTHTHIVGMGRSGGYVRVPCGLANLWVYPMGLGYLILKRKVWLLNL